MRVFFLKISTRIRKICNEVYADLDKGQADVAEMIHLAIVHAGAEHRDNYIKGSVIVHLYLKGTFHRFYIVGP